MRLTRACICLTAFCTIAAANERTEAVKEVFRRTWAGYRKHAWGHDSLRPVSNTFADDRNGWGASAVDALSTAILMGETDAIKDILDYIPTINFGQTSTEVSVFETTIRYLGGLLSGYDLLQGPYKELAPNQRAVDALLDQAVALADNLKIAFDTPTGIPDNELLFDPTPRKKGNTETGLAVSGTLVLEWERLSDLTGNKEYGQLAKRAEYYLLDPKPLDAQPFPGLVGSRISIENGTFTNNQGGWAGGSDSFYEYLIKMYVYDPARFESYKERWVLAVESSMQYLATHPTTRPDLTFLSLFWGQSRQFYSGHLACFDGGNFILGGLVLGEQRYVDFGLELTAGCRETYAQTATGIGPEVFRWRDNETDLGIPSNDPPPADQAAMYERAGFWVINGQYVLRPEVIESYYHAYVATGDQMYRDWAWEAFVNINRTCSVGSGVSSIRDVNRADGNVEYHDFQESFWFAEVLKYSYLIQAEDSDVQIKRDGKNLFVFNTEAHPVKVFATGKGGDDVQRRLRRKG